MTAYMDSGFKKLYLSMTDCLSNWINAKKKKEYSSEW